MKDIILKAIFGLLQAVAAIFHTEIEKKEEQSKGIEKAIAWAQNILNMLSDIAAGTGPVPHINTGFALLDLLEDYVIAWLEKNKEIESNRAFIEEILQNLQALLKEIAPPVQATTQQSSVINIAADQLVEHAANIQNENVKGFGSSMITNASNELAIIGSALKSGEQTAESVIAHVEAIGKHIDIVKTIAAGHTIIGESVKIIEGIIADLTRLFKK